MIEKPTKERMERLLNATEGLKQCIEFASKDYWWLQGVRYWSAEIEYLTEFMRDE